MMPFRYDSGEEVRAGDLIRYHGDLGHVEFLVTPENSDPTLVYYLELNPGGGAMLEVKESFGYVFVNFPDEHLEFVSRGQ
jgi:hypothetical protein